MLFWPRQGDFCCCEEEEEPTDCLGLGAVNLYLTDSHGTWEMHPGTIGPSFAEWKCCHTLTHANTKNFCDVSTNCFTPGISGTVTVAYHLICRAEFAYIELIQSMRQFNCTFLTPNNWIFDRCAICSGDVQAVSGPPAPNDGGGNLGLSDTDATPTSGPFTASFLYPSTFGAGPYPTLVPGTVTVSE